MRDIFAGGDVNNLVSPRSVYGGYPGASTGIRASALTPYAAQGGGGDPVGPANTSDGNAAPATGSGKPALMTWALLLVLLFGLMFLSKKVGTQGSDFTNVRVSAWNVLIITLAAV